MTVISKKDTTTLLTPINIPTYMNDDFPKKDEVSKEPILPKIKIHFKFSTKGLYFEDDTESRNIYWVTIIYNKKMIGFRFGDSIANTVEGFKLEDEKDKAEILESCYSDYYNTKENYPTYHDFASEFGYDKDSIKGNKIYRAATSQAAKLHKLFSEEEIEQIRKELDF